MTPSIEVLRFSDSRQLVQAVARRWLAELRSKPAQGTALSGGRIAVDFFRELARQVRETHAVLAETHFFWADERCVPPEHADSNYRIAAESLLRPAGIPVANVHRIAGENSPLAAAAEAELALRSWARETALGQPVLDLVLLGMGEDGHVASLFPGASHEVEESVATYLAVVGPKPPPQRISLSYNAIAAARQVWVLASGAGKQTALRRSLEEGGTPLARVLKQRGEATVFTDIVL